VAEPQYGDPVADRFHGKTCLLCGARPSVGVGEHVVPRWFKGDFAQEGLFKSENAGVPYTNRDGGLAIQETLPVPRAPMCVEWNGRLNTFLEDPAKPVIRKLIPQSPDHEWPTLTQGEAAALGKWLLKVCLLWAHPDSDDDNPEWRRGQTSVGSRSWSRSGLPGCGTALNRRTGSPCTSLVETYCRFPLDWTRAEDRAAKLRGGRRSRGALYEARPRHTWPRHHRYVAPRQVNRTPACRRRQGGRALAESGAVDFAQFGEVREGEISIVIANDTAGAT
jgi:hypothetical protein